MAKTHEQDSPRHWKFLIAIRPVAKALLAGGNRFLRAVSPDATFFDTRDFPWTREVEAAFPDIHRECLEAVRDLNNVPNLEDLEDAGSQHLARGGDWKAVLLMIFGRPVPGNVRRCPQTYAALQKIPGVQSALFSILAPGVHLPRHEGPFSGVLRYHMGILVPPGNVCRISVDDETRTWEAGGSLIFDDTHPHEVWNDSDQIRVVLFVDFVRPMAPPLRWAVRALFALAARTPLARNFIRNAEF